MSTRITQLSTRGFAYAMTGVGTWLATSDSTAATAFADSFAGEGMMYTLAVAAAGVDLYIHKSQTGGVLKPAGGSNSPESESPES